MFGWEFRICCLIVAEGRSVIFSRLTFSAAVKKKKIMFKNEMFKLVSLQLPIVN